MTRARLSVHYNTSFLWALCQKLAQALIHSASTSTASPRRASPAFRRLPNLAPVPSRGGWLTCGDPCRRLPLWPTVEGGSSVGVERLSADVYTFKHCTSLRPWYTS